MTVDRRPLRAVTFDLGETLWHFPRRPSESAVAHHLEARIRHLLATWGVTADVSVPGLQRQLTGGRLALQQRADETDGSGAAYADYLAHVRGVASSAGLAIDEWQVFELWQALDAGGAFLGRVVSEDTVPTLEWLRTRGVRVAALTNRSHGGASFLEELRTDGLLPYFDAVVASDQVGYRKPHPAIFERALAALGVSPEDCAHVGDRLDADVAGARRSGMVAIWMRRNGQHTLRPGAEAPAEPHYTIERVGEIAELGLF